MPLDSSSDRDDDMVCADDQVHTKHVDRPSEIFSSTSEVLQDTSNPTQDRIAGDTFTNLVLSGEFCWYSVHMSIRIRQIKTFL